MKKYIIDGHNLIHKSSFLYSKFQRDPSVGLSSLCELINQLAAKRGSYEFTIVFDGEPVNLSIYFKSNVKVLYSGKGRKADNKIKDLVSKIANTGNYIIVSSDVEIYNHAKVHACEVVLSEDFAKELPVTFESIPRTGYPLGVSKSTEKPFSSSRREIEEFKKLFGE